MTNALSSGAQGYALKTIDPCKLTDAIRNILKGEIFLDSPLANKLLSKYSELGQGRIRNEFNLSALDIEILEMLSTGLIYKQIADEKYYSEITIKRRALSIFQKLGAINCPHTITIAIKKGLL